MPKHASKQSTAANTFQMVVRGFGILIPIVLSVLAISWATLGQDWDAIVKSPDFPVEGWSVKHWEASVENIRLHESEEYVESIMGLPQICEMKQTKKVGDHGRQVEYEEAIYINKFFTLCCVYVDDALEGFLIISNDESFRPLNYRIGFRCIGEPIAAVAKRCDELKMYNMCIAANPSDRMSSNSYYMECKEQHPYGASEFVLIGYGVCDIGLWADEESIYDVLNANQEEYGRLLEKRILASNDVAADLGRAEKMPVEVYAITHDDSLAIRGKLVNAYFVFNDSSTIGFELLCDSLMNKVYLGINRDTYASFMTDYPRGYLPASK